MSGPTELLLVSATVPVLGFLVAVAARLLIGLRRAPRLSWAASTLCGIVGAAAGASSTALAMGRPVRDVPFAVILGALAGTVVLIVVADQVLRARAAPAPTARELIAAGESDRVEFKSSARYNRHTGARDARLELVIACTVAAFGNGRGGTLLIGVADDGGVVGLADDYQLVRRADRDNYELWLRDLLTGTLGAPVAETVGVDFETLDGQDVCLVRVPAAARPVFVRAPKQPRTEFVVRIGNSTRELDPRDMLDYASTRWSRRRLAHRRGRRRADRPAPAGRLLETQD